MKITSINTLHCDAGWRPWTFVKITTDEGLTGWSECTDSHGSPLAIQGVVQDLSPILVGQDPRNAEALFWKMYSRTRQSPGSIIQKAIGGIENAVYDIKAKALGVPIYDLFGGPLRTKIPLYWSHCGTTRVRAWQLVDKNQIATIEDVKEFAAEIRHSCYKVIKTNIVILDEEPHVYMPGFFRSSGGPELNPDRRVLSALERYIGTLRETLGEEFDIILDLNFNFKPEGYIKIGRLLDKFDLLWIELDCYDPDAVLQIRESIATPICSGENLYGMRGYRPFLEKHAMDIASVDVTWNGFAQSMKIAHLAELYEVNVTPHNYYSHLATFISAQFSAAVPNLRIMEVDVDDVPWKDDLVTVTPKIEDGYLELSGRSGWGTEIREEVLNAYPWPAK